MEQIIKQKLKEIEAQEDVKILLAVESGSRAWGFSSSDSDYDVRFIYVRPRNEYLKLKEKRDVIEWQLDDTLDISGWDLKKALLLLYKSNATLFEWAQSPIVYYKDPDFGKFKSLLPQYFTLKKVIYHYWHMADTNYRQLAKQDSARLKQYFYILRPLLAAQWIMAKETVPPIVFQVLVEAMLQADLKPLVQQLLDLKEQTRELDQGRRIAELDAYFERTLIEVKAYVDNLTDAFNTIEPLDALFLSYLEAE